MKDSQACRTKIQFLQCKTDYHYIWLAKKLNAAKTH